MRHLNCEKVLLSTLYIVPTPIGNLNDITYRALFILRKVDLIASEDTRRTKVLLRYFSINTPLFIFHGYNEKRKTLNLISKLQSGSAIALVSDSGTPLISDPGYYLVCACYLHGLRVVPLPGACAAIAALSASGLSTNRFCFEGFLPTKRQSRINYFQTLLQETRTLVFYDSKYRVANTVQDMLDVFGSERRVVLVRELTKIWESIYRASLKELLQWIKDGKICIQGEIVLILEGCLVQEEKLDPKIKDMIQCLSKELPFKKVINLIKNVYGINKNIIYDYILKKDN